MRFRSLCLAVLATCGCSHTQLTGAELDRVQRPAYVGRLADGAGPKAQGVGTSEAQLVVAMNAAIGKFEVSERLRSQLAVALRGQAPWSNAVPASQVASALETFLVERDPPVPPEYSRLKPTGADAVLEVVVEDYGLKAQGTVAQTYLRGYARLFLLADGSEVWRGPFERVRYGPGAVGCWTLLGWPPTPRPMGTSCAHCSTPRRWTRPAAQSHRARERRWHAGERGARPGRFAGATRPSARAAPGPHAAGGPPGAA